MPEFPETEWSKRTPFHHLQILLALISGVVSPLVVVFAGWSSIPRWGQLTILGIVSIVALIYIVVPTTRFVNNRVRRFHQKTLRRKILTEIQGLIREASMLFDPHSVSSLRHYVEAIANLLIQNSDLHSKLQRLSERSLILSHWHDCLLVLTDRETANGQNFDEVIRNVSRFYHGVSDVVRELASIDISKENTARAYDNDARMAKQKYNQHVERIDQVLSRVAEHIPNFHVGIFHRF